MTESKLVCERPAKTGINAGFPARGTDAGYHRHCRRARQRAGLIATFTSAELDARMAFWGNQCWMCSGPFQEVDHVISLARGGPHCLSNLRPSCRSCNASKGAKSVAEVLRAS